MHEDQARGRFVSSFVSAARACASFSRWMPDAGYSTPTDEAQGDVRLLQGPAPACLRGRGMSAAAEADAPNRAGSKRGALAHKGVLVAANSVPVETDIMAPANPAGIPSSRASRRSRAERLRSAQNCAAAVSALRVPNIARVQEPMDIADVLRKIRSMLYQRCGVCRSSIGKRGPVAAPASAR